MWRVSAWLRVLDTACTPCSLYYQYDLSYCYKEHWCWVAGWVLSRYIWHYHENITLKLTTSKIKNVMMIKRWMENIFQMSWKYLRQQSKDQKYQTVIWFSENLSSNFRRMRTCWTRLNDISIEHLCFLESF